MTDLNLIRLYIPMTYREKKKKTQGKQSSFFQAFIVLTFEFSRRENSLMSCIPGAHSLEK